MRKLVISRIELWAQNGSLADHPRLLAILYAWRYWGSEKNCRHFAEQLTSTDRGLITFLNATLDKAITQAMTAYEKNPAWQVYLEDIEIFIPTSMLEEHAKTLFEDPYFEKLREREQLALMIFLDLTKASAHNILNTTTPQY